MVTWKEYWLAASFSMPMRPRWPLYSNTGSAAMPSRTCPCSTTSSSASPQSSWGRPASRPPSASSSWAKGLLALYTRKYHSPPPISPNSSTTTSTSTATVFLWPFSFFSRLGFSGLRRLPPGDFVSACAAPSSSSCAARLSNPLMHSSPFACSPLCRSSARQRVFQR